MTSAPTSLPPTEGQPPDQQFWGLYDQAMARTPELCADVWTDYNAHDPGVTVLEQLCYALTELGYRARGPLEELLRGADGRLDLTRLGLFSARRMLPCAPLTPGDLQRLLLDRLPGVHGAWVSLPPRDHSASAGRYDIHLYAPGLRANDPRRRTLRRAAARLLERHRNLCEGVGRVVVLRPRAVTVRADVELAGDRSPEAEVAAMLRRLELQLAPEAARLGLAETPGGGARLAEVLEGPPLRGGWIPAAALAPRPLSWLPSALAHAMADDVGVRAVRDFTLGGADPAGRDQELRVAPGEVLVLDMGEVGRPLDLQVRRGGAPAPVDADRVRALLHRLRTQDRAPRTLWRDVGRARPAPASGPAARTAFASVQADLPGVYGLREDAREESAQVRQLRGYLLGFDLQILKTLAAIDAAAAVEPTESGAEASDFYARVRAELPGGEELVVPTTEALGADAVARDTFRAGRLRRRLALYGHAPDDLSPRETSLAGLDRALAWAARRPGARRRAPGLAPAGLRRSDLERALALRHGVGVARNALDAALTDLHVVVTDEGDVRLDGRACRPLAPEALGAMAPVGRIDPREAVRSTRIGVPARLLDLGCEVWLGRDGRAALAAGGAAWELGLRRAPEDAARAAQRVAGSLAAARRAAERVHLIEHPRLLDGRSPDDRFPYAATFTLVVCAPGRGGSAAFREGVAHDVRRLAPAHLHARTAFVDVAAALRFERLVATWRREGRAGGRQARRDACRALRDALAATLAEPAG